MTIIDIESASWPDRNSLDLKVVEFVHQRMTYFFKRELPYNIMLQYSHEYPMTLHRNGMPRSIPTVIQLTSERLNLWCQVAYQLSHELCHVLTNYEKQKAHIANQWLVEALCETASICVLEAMDVDWRDTSVKPSFQMYARQESIRKYIEGEMRKYRVEDLPAYFRQWQTNMRKDPYVRDGQAQACNRLAGRIIPYFMKDPSLWIECQIINEWDLSNCESVEEYLQAWHQSLRDSQQQTRLPGIISDLLGLDT